MLQPRAPIAKGIIFFAQKCSNSAIFHLKIPVIVTVPKLYFRWVMTVYYRERMMVFCQYIDNGVTVEDIVEGNMGKIK